MQDTHWLQRTKLLIGDEKLTRLANAHVLIVGMGGVGSYAAEAIARSGVGKLTIADGDVVDPTNRNRQLPAMKSTHGLSKVALMAERILDINPEINLKTVPKFLAVDEMKELLAAEKYDYVVDAIDSITPKLTLLSTCFALKIPIISSMGAGGRLDPTLVKVADISESYNCRLAHYVRKRLGKYGIKTGIKVVFSNEPMLESSLMLTDGSNFKRSAFGTIAWIPATFGLTCASVVVRDLIEWPAAKTFPRMQAKKKK